MAGKVTPDRAMQGLVLTVVVLAIAGFAFMVLRAIWQTIEMDTTPPISDQYTYVATGLAGLVGGVVAVGLGQANPSRGGDGNNAAASTGMSRVLPSNSVRSWAMVGYTAVFVILGAACVALWVQDSHPADLVKAEASVALGLFIPTAGAYFRS